MNSRRFMVASTTGDRVLEDVSRINLRLDLHQSREVVAPAAQGISSLRRALPRDGLLGV
jgi:hypothetical protein